MCSAASTPRCCIRSGTSAFSPETCTRSPTAPTRGVDTDPLIGISTGFTDYGDYLGVAFSRPLERCGAIAVTLPYTDRPDALLSKLDGLVLAVGRDIDPNRFDGHRHPSATQHSPLRDDAELALARAAIAAGLPVLGICRGMQIINVARGGTLHPDHSVLPAPANNHLGGDWGRWELVVHARLADAPPPQHPTHAIAIVPGSALERALGPRAVVNSYHHQSIDVLGNGLAATATAPDGVIEAIELLDAPALCLGVQWELQEQPDSPIWQMVVRAAQERAADRGLAPAARG